MQPGAKHSPPRRPPPGAGTCLALAACLTALAAFAQTPAAPLRIGFLTTGWGPPLQAEGLVAGLIDLGYRENVDFVVAVRFTEGDAAALPAAAEALVASGVDVIVPVTSLPAAAAQSATSTVPIVFVRVADPVGQGLIESYSRPGGNVTGVIDPDVNMAGKRLQLFQALVPGLKRVLFPHNGDNPYHVAQAAEYRGAAERLEIELVARPLATMGEAAGLFADLRQGDVDGILTPRDTDLDIPGLIVEATQRRKIPSMFDVSYYTGIGGLASYGESMDEVGRQAARLIDKIINGGNPAEIPVEAAPFVEFVVNLKVAEELGIVIPREILYQADRIIR